MLDLLDQSPYSAGFCVRFALNIFHCFFKVDRRPWLALRSGSCASVFNDLVHLVRFPIEIEISSCNFRDGIVLSEIIFRPNDLFPLPSLVAAVAMDMQWS